MGEIEGLTEPREVHTVTADLAAAAGPALLESVVTGADAVLSGRRERQTRFRAPNFGAVRGLVAVCGVGATVS